MQDLQNRGEILITGVISQAYKSQREACLTSAVSAVGGNQVRQSVIGVKRQSEEALRPMRVRIPHGVVDLARQCLEISKEERR